MLRLFKNSQKDPSPAKGSSPPPSPNRFNYPSAPDVGLEIFQHTLRVQASIEIKTKTPVSSLRDCLKILEIWVDEARCPIWQYPLDSWMFFCMGVHAQRDPRCTFSALYRAQIDEVLTFSHTIKEFDPNTLRPVNISFDTAYKGHPCEVRFINNMTKSRRVGAPFDVLYYAPLKDGTIPPPMTEWNINLPFKLKKTEQDLVYLMPAEL
ncbi:M protein [Kolente virus]|uniref:M protein n=1 Tax=Kolente virus TaxID=1428456 RepID=V5PZL9_9RHAB|nr:M protein [Kolente virus]AHB08863.1 M protein [Kolente virus]